MNGIALTVLISQLPKLFGFSIEAHGPLRDSWQIAQAVHGRQANWTTFAVGAGTLAVILLLKRFKRIPGILIAVVGATVVVGAAGPRGTRRRQGARLRCRRACPRSPCRGSPRRHSAPSLIGGLRRRHGGVRRHERAVAHLCGQDPYAMSIRTRRWSGWAPPTSPPDSFRAFPISSSSSRTPVAEAAGAQTQLTGVVGALAVALLLMVAPNLLQICPPARWPPS